MDYERAKEVAAWMAKVSDRYNRPILLVIDDFKKAMDKHKDINLAKVQVVERLSKT